VKKEQIEKSKALLGEDTFEMLIRVHEDAIWMLESLGVGCTHPVILKIYEKFEEEGLAIFFEDRIYITSDLLFKSLESVPDVADFFVPPTTVLVGNNASHVYNDATGKGGITLSAGHIVRIAKAAGKNSSVGGLGTGPALKNDALQMGLMAEHCQKPLCLRITSDAGFEKAKALHAERKDIMAEFPMISPMETDGKFSDAFVRAVEAGLPLMVTSKPLAGVDAPYCYNSVLAMAHAEVLFGICTAQLLNPGLVCVHGGSPAIADPQNDFTPNSSLMGHDIANILMAHLSLILDIPTCQRAGADIKSGKALCLKYGMHMVCHSFGILPDSGDFSFAKLEEDMEMAETVKAEDAPDVKMPVYDERGMESLRRNELKSYKDDPLTKENAGKVFVQ